MGFQGAYPSGAAFVLIWRSCSQIFRLKILISSYILGEVLPKFFLTHSSSAVTLDSSSFNPHSYIGCLGGPDPIVQQTDDTIIHLVLLDSTPKLLSMVSEHLFLMRQFITVAKILDSKRNKLVKPPFFYEDAIADDHFNVVAEECHWLREVNVCKMFLPPMVRCYSIFDYQHESIVRTMSKKISAYQDRIAFGRVDCQGGHSTKMGMHGVRLYPGKYGTEIPVCEELVKANIFTNRFSAEGGKYPSKDFRAEGWIYEPPSHWWLLLVRHILKKCETSLRRCGLYDAMKVT